MHLLDIELGYFYKVKNTFFLYVVSLPFGTIFMLVVKNLWCRRVLQGISVPCDITVGCGYGYNELETFDKRSVKTLFRPCIKFILFHNGQHVYYYPLVPAVNNRIHRYYTFEDRDWKRQTRVGIYTVPVDCICVHMCGVHVSMFWLMAATCNWQ